MEPYGGKAANRQRVLESACLVSGKLVARQYWQNRYNIDRVETADIFESLRNSFCQCEGFESLRGTF